MNLIPNIIFIAKEDRQSTVLSRVSPTPAVSDTPPKEPEEEFSEPVPKKQQYLDFDIRKQGEHAPKIINTSPSPLSYSDERPKLKPSPLKNSEPKGLDTHKIGDLRHQVDIATRMVLKVVSFTPAPETDERKNELSDDITAVPPDDNLLTPSPQTELVQSSRYISSKPLGLNEK